MRRARLVRGGLALLLVLLGGPGCLSYGAWLVTGNEADTERPTVERVRALLVQRDPDGSTRLRLTLEVRGGDDWLVVSEHAIAPAASWQAAPSPRPRAVLLEASDPASATRRKDAPGWEGLRVGAPVDVPRASDGVSSGLTVPLEVELARHAVVACYVVWPARPRSSVPLELSIPPPGGRRVGPGGELDRSQDVRATVVGEAPPAEEGVPLSSRIAFGALVPFAAALDLALSPFELVALWILGGLPGSAGGH